MGTSELPTALNDCAKLRRRSEDSGGPENRNVRIGADFEKRLAGGHDKKGEQEKPVLP